MKLSDWGIIAEIVSAIAIVVSLIFVGFEIRSNTQAEYLSSYDRLLADNGNWWVAQATNPETMLAFLEYYGAEDHESLDATVQGIGSAMGTAAIQIYERAYFAHTYGRLGDAEWSRYQRIMCNPDNDTFQASLNSELFSEEFWQFLMSCLPEEAP